MTLDTQDHDQAHMHAAPASMAAAVHERLLSRDRAKGVPVMTAVIDELGGLAITGSSIRLPPTAYVIPANIGAVTPGDAVLVAFADEGQSKRPHILASLSRATLETGTLQADGLHLTIRGVVVDTYHVCASAQQAWAAAHAGAAIPMGSGVVVGWADYGAAIMPYVLAVL